MEIINIFLQYLNFYYLVKFLKIPKLEIIKYLKNNKNLKKWEAYAQEKKPQPSRNQKERAVITPSQTKRSRPKKSRK